MTNITNANLIDDSWKEPFRSDPELMKYLDYLDSLPQEEQERLIWEAEIVFDMIALKVKIQKAESEEERQKLNREYRKNENALLNH